MSDADERDDDPQFPDPPEWNYKRKPTDSINRKTGSYEGIANGIKFAYMLIGPMVAGWFVGYLIDRGQASGNGQLWGAIAGFFAGILVVAVLMNRQSGSGK